MDNTLVGMEKSAVAVIQRCSVNKDFKKFTRKYLCCGLFLIKISVFCKTGKQKRGVLGLISHIA